MLPQQVVATARHFAVAFASVRDQPSGIDDFDMSAGANDEAGMLQRVRRDRHGVALNAEHARDKVLGQRERVAARVVASVRQPSGEPKLHGVDGVAGGRLLRLDEQRALVRSQELSKIGASVRSESELLDVDARSGPGHRDRGALRGRIVRIEGPRAEKSLAPHHRDVDRMSVRQAYDKANQAIVRKVDMSQLRARINK